MGRLFVAFAVAMWFAGHAASREDGADVQLAFELGDRPFSIELPYKNNVFVEEFATLVLRIHDPDLEKIRIYTSTAQRLTIDLTKKRPVVCQSLRFRIGENFISAIGYKMGQKVHKERVKFYTRDIRSKMYKYVPAEFSKRYFHNKEGESACANCHDMSVNERPKEPFEDISESNCYTCHKVLLDRKYGHAPVVNFICTPCHGAKSEKAAPAGFDATRFPSPDTIGPMCLKCHEDKQKIWRTKNYIHDPVGGDKCTKCHNPHSSDVNKNFLRKPVWKLCTSCHMDKMDRRRYERLFALRAKKGERFYKELLERGFDCVTCHDPHASNARFMIHEDLEHNLSNVCFAISVGGAR